MKVIDLLKHHAQEANWSLPWTSIARVDALKVGAELGLNTRKIDMISVDHWFRSGLYWP